ncbi:cysteine desulfurase family protein [Marinobacter sp. F4216]|uniref:cysteine desulfurase family protein n=1 Tax=Marinobacter sp. F4216 TaxID=2874281 RepID=UPI001CBC6099|nr:cysteine desulfurase family protein [Marinobacter sp. F4216]MBZ2168270.1 cysteine desulfurase [Marinobacter sp. F4216]
MLDNLVYLDYNASTPVDERVLQGMMPFFTQRYGNASSKSHCMGWDASSAVEQARLQVLTLIGAKSPDEIIFTSGATESNNLAIRGVLEAVNGKHVITSAIEHPCVLNLCQSLKPMGVQHTSIRPDKSGVISPAAVEAAIRPDTALISVMAVNHEIGTIQPIREIAEVAKRHGILFHVDAAQGAGKVPLNVHKDGIDLLSISAHKIYGPKGVGALYRRKTPKETPINPQMIGGGQERGIRSGTLNVPGIVGLGLACHYAGAEMAHNQAIIHGLRERFLNRVRTETDQFHIHGSMERRVAGNLNIAFGEVPAEKLINALKTIAVSGGSACSSGQSQGSPVLRAMGYDQTEATRAVRMSFSHLTTEKEVDIASRIILDNAFRLGLEQSRAHCA